MATMENSIEIKVLLIEEDGWWSAQCLEHDIAAQARSLSELRYEMGRVLIAHVVHSECGGKEPFEGIGEAPKKYWDMYEKSDLQVVTTIETIIQSTPTLKHPIPRPQFRVAEKLAA